MRAFIILSCVVLAFAKPQGYSYIPPVKENLSSSNTHVAPSISLTAPSFAPCSAAPAPLFHAPAPVVHHVAPAPVQHHRVVAPAPVQQFHPLPPPAPVTQARIVTAPAPLYHPAPVQHFQPAPAPAPVQHFQPAPAPVQHFQPVPAPAPVQQFHPAPAPAPVPVPVYGAPPQPQFVPAQSQVQTSYQFPPEQSIVQKHIYVHVPPAEEEEVAASTSFQQQLPPRQKHYKIIFIKAPSAAPSYNTQVLQQLAAPQIEEKTLVYVLSKKPEEVVPSEVLAARQVQAAQPSKPEVYFIKYKAQKEQQLTGSSSIPVSSIADLPQVPAPTEVIAPIVRKPATVYGPAK